MQINNRKNVISLRITQLFITIGLIAVLAILFTTRLIKPPFLGMEISHIALVFVAAYVLYMAYQVFMDWNFIFFSDEGEKIIFRYYSIRPFSKGSHSIEIPKSSFHKYIYSRKILGLKPTITLYQKLREGIGKFPTISVAALGRKDLARLRESLDRHSRR